MGNADKLERKSKAGNKTRIIKGKRFTKIKDDLPHDDAVELAEERRKSTGKRHVVVDGAGGTSVFEGPKPKKPSRKRKKSTGSTSRSKPKKGKLNKGLKVHNDLRSAEKAVCDGEKNRSEIQKEVDAYEDYQMKERGMTRKQAETKSGELKKCRRKGQKT